MFQIVVFYIIFSLFGFLGLPLVRRAGLSEKAPVLWVAGKIAGLLTFGYLVWFLASLNLLDYQNKLVISLGFLTFGIYGIFDTYKHLSGKTRPEKKSWLLSLVKTEAISSVLFLAYLYIRSYHPDIYDTERFMDMAWLTSSGKTSTFPFLDPWYQGKTVNYYYYGSYLMSLIANLGRVPYVYAYTAALGVLYSGACMLAGVLTYEITAKKSYAALSAFLVTTAGTLFYSGCVLKGFFQTPETVCSWTSSTRLFTPSYIINEIPSYSFTVGDLHAHFLALLPFLFNLILVYGFVKTEKPNKLLTVLLSFGFATSFLSNSWDAITLSVLLALAVLYKFYETHEQQGRHYIARIKSISPFIVSAGLAGLLSGLMILPYILKFHLPVLGFKFVPQYVWTNKLINSQWPTPFSAFFGMWGVFLIGIFWPLWHLRKKLVELKFPLLLTATSLFFLVFVELFFVADIYSVANPPYFRANTVFKFGYHIWIMLSVAFSVMLWAILNPQSFSLNSKKKAVFQNKYSGWIKFGVCVFIFFSLYYPYQALKQYYGLFGGSFKSAFGRSLDGSEFMKNTGIGDYEAVKFINQHIQGRKVLMEAVGDSYKYNGRISVFTGMINPINWLSHEWTWRLDAEAAKKAKPGEQVETGYGKVSAIGQDVKTIYETPDVNMAKSLLGKYQVKYVYIGSLEWSTYPALQENKFASLGKIIYDANGVKIYQVVGSR